MKEPALKEETLDDVIHGRLKILQKARGYRFSVDALLLAHFVRLNPQDKVLELGTGSGIISMLLAGRSPMAAITAIEIQEKLAEMARRSVAINGLDEKIVIREGDVREIREMFPAHSFDVVVSNPPYRKAASGRINPVPEKALARHELMGTVRDFLQAAGYVLRLAGRAFFIYPATRMAELVCSMRGARIEPKRLRIVYSNHTEAGKFVLVEGVRGGGEELEVMPPLIIYDDQGEYTDEMQGLFRELSSPCPGGS